MSSHACARRWEAAAVLDGRLDGSGRASFERHASGCAECTREVSSLAALGELGAKLPSFRATPLEQRRSRIALLRAANDRVVSGKASPRVWGAGLGAVAVAAVAAGLWLMRPSPSPVARPVAPAAAAQVVFDVVEQGSASWRRLEEGPRTRLELISGTLAIHVGRLAPGQRFVLALPDGDLEVHGTRFVVRVEGGRSRAVEVSEGVVALRLRGEGERSLSAGERWVSDPPLEVAARADGVAAEGSAPASPIRTAPAAPEPASRANPGPRAARPETRARAAPPDAKPTPAPAARYGDAVTAFGDGSYGRADKLLAEFTALAPDDARGEDAAFLRAVARARLGDRSAAAALAREYLARFPYGLRRAEAERLVRSGE